jgi:hypothetical protein
MNEERKLPIWPWIAVLLIVLPVFYVASFGLAVRVWRSGWISDRAFVVMYQPAARFVMHSPSGLQTTIFWVWTHSGVSDIELFFLLSDCQHGPSDDRRSPRAAAPIGPAEKPPGCEVSVPAEVSDASDAR